MSPCLVLQSHIERHFTRNCRGVAPETTYLSKQKYWQVNRSAERWSVNLFKATEQLTGGLTTEPVFWLCAHHHCLPLNIWIHLLILWHSQRFKKWLYWIEETRLSLKWKISKNMTCTCKIKLLYVMHLWQLVPLKSNTVTLAPLSAFPNVWQTYSEGQEKNGNDVISYHKELPVFDI